MGEQHISVLVHEVADYIACRDDGVYVDATLGSGGHALHLLQRYAGIGRLIGIDCDLDAVARAQNNLKPFFRKVTILHGNFRDLKSLLAGIGIKRIDGILFDLGVSTPQLKDPGRGFSFNLEGVLDMRMNHTMRLQAKDLLEQLSERELSDVLRNYGQERWAKRIARHVKTYQKQTPIVTTTELSRVVLKAIPSRYYPSAIHPATRTFQALRIAVNDELAALEQGLNDALELLNPGGRLCAISFHSLEDGIVKHTFKTWEKGCTCPSTIPVCVCNGKKRLKVITRKPVAPSEQEMRANPSARSARLRVGERI